MEEKNLRERVTTWLFSRFPALAERWAENFEAVKGGEIPWAPFQKPLSACRVALVTTAGVHLRGDLPFDMADEEGDPTCRAIPGDVPTDRLMITHKYYDHGDADRDINIVFPLERLREMARSGEIGGVSSLHFGVMGHIVGSKIRPLMTETAPDIAARLREAGADIALLTPG